MAGDAQTLKPEPRGPVDSQRATPGDPTPPALVADVRALSSEIRLNRIQAENRLRQAGAKGVMAAADFLVQPGNPDSALIEAMNFLMRIDFESLDAAQATRVRDQLAALLVHAHDDVRATAARALQVIGPGSQRTAFLRAITDPERRVRWAVVRRFGDFAEEADRAQLLILLGFLQGGMEADFDRADTNRDGSLARDEFLRGNDEFARLDKNSDGAISRNEWTSPVDSPVRADVYTVLLRLHEKLTPDLRPIVYNPWAPAGPQQDAITAWQRWVEALPQN